MSGRSVMTQVTKSTKGYNAEKLDVGELNAGIYYIHLNNGEDQIVRNLLL